MTIIKKIDVRVEIGIYYCGLSGQKCLVVTYVQWEGAWELVCPAQTDYHAICSMITGELGESYFGEAHNYRML